MSNVIDAIEDHICKLVKDKKSFCPTYLKDIFNIDYKTAYSIAHNFYHGWVSSSGYERRVNSNNEIEYCYVGQVINEPVSGLVEKQVISVPEPIVNDEARNITPINKPVKSYITRRPKIDNDGNITSGSTRSSNGNHRISFSTDGAFGKWYDENTRFDIVHVDDNTYIIEINDDGKHRFHRNNDASIYISKNLFGAGHYANKSIVVEFTGSVYSLGMKFIVIDEGISEEVADNIPDYVPETIRKYYVRATDNRKHHIIDINGNFIAGVNGSQSGGVYFAKDIVEKFGINHNTKFDIILLGRANGKSLYKLVKSRIGAHVMSHNSSSSYMPASRFSKFHRGENVIVTLHGNVNNNYIYVEISHK